MAHGDENGKWVFTVKKTHMTYIGTKPLTTGGLKTKNYYVVQNHLQLLKVVLHAFTTPEVAIKSIQVGGFGQYAVWGRYSGSLRV